MQSKYLYIIMALGILAAAIWYFDLVSLLTFENVKNQQKAIEAFYQDNMLLTIGGFFLLYVVVLACSLPAATVLTLLAGAIFGLVLGTVIVSFASTIGASLAFLVVRNLTGDLVERVQVKYEKQLKPINDGVERDGAFYLFALRLVPAFPLFLINIAMALTRMRLFTFYWVSQLGMLAGTIVYVNAGTQLAQISEIRDIVSPQLIIAFVLLGLFPIIAKKALDFIRKRLGKSEDAVATESET